MIHRTIKLLMIIAVMAAWSRAGLAQSPGEYPGRDVAPRERMVPSPQRRLQTSRVEHARAAIGDPMRGTSVQQAGYVGHYRHSAHPAVAHHCMTPGCQSGGCHAGGCMVGGCMLGDCLRGFLGCYDNPPPGESLGGSVQGFLQAQIANGRQLQLMMYQYDFLNDPAADLTQLNPAGRQKLARLVSVLQESGGRLGMEASRFGEAVTEGRRASVAEFLSETLGYGISADQIEVRLPDSPGVRGVEAMEIDRTLLQNTSSQGATLGNSGGSSGGFFGGGQQGVGLGR